MRDHRRTFAWLAAFALTFYVIGLYLVRFSHLRGFGGQTLSVVFNTYVFLWPVLVLLAALIWLGMGKEASTGERMAILAMVAVVLFFTPYFVAGGGRGPDSLWHPSLGVDLLSGPATLNSYPDNYPGSFLANGFLFELFKGDIVTFAAITIPLLLILAFPLVWYGVAQRFLRPHLAFTAAVFGLVGLHYTEFHPSPNAFSLLLVIAAMVCVAHQPDIRALVVGGVLLAVVVVTHPMNPLPLLGFIGLIFTPLVLRTRRRMVIGVGLFLVALTTYGIWVTLFTNHGVKLLEGILDIALLRIPASHVETLFSYLTGSGSFLFPSIVRINVIIYAVYAGLGLVAGLLVFRLMRRQGWQRALRTVAARKAPFPTMLFLGLAAIGLGIAFGTVLVQGVQDLIARGLVFFILAAPVAMVLAAAGPLKVPGRAHTILWVTIAALLFLFPLVSYSIDDYNGFPPSEIAGLKHTAALGGEVAGYSLHQLEAFESGAGDGSYQVFRESEFMNAGLRNELSLTDNSVIASHARFTTSTAYHRVYANPNYEVFMAVGAGA